MKYYINKADIEGFLRTLIIDSRIFYLTDKLSYAKFGERGFTESLGLDKIRAMVPLKAFFLEHGQHFAAEPAAEIMKTILFGIKNCDLRAKNIMDAFFLEHVEPDTFYEIKNRNTLIFASDCPAPDKNCFCGIVGGKPYIDNPSDLRKGTGYDLNFSPAPDGFIVETGSSAGEAIIKQTQAFFKDASQEQVAHRDASRKKAVELMEDINKDFLKLRQTNLQKVAQEKYFDDWWKKASATCVQCTGCNMICPSCYCFYLVETPAGKDRYWDACHFSAYARMAGGATPMPKVYQRFRNRYQCKFNFRMQNYGQYACTGCGRCIEVSPCLIDIRKTMAGMI